MKTLDGKSVNSKKNFGEKHELGFQFPISKLSTAIEIHCCSKGRVDEDNMTH